MIHQVGNEPSKAQLEQQPRKIFVEKMQQKLTQTSSSQKEPVLS